MESVDADAESGVADAEAAVAAESRVVSPGRAVLVGSTMVMVLDAMRGGAAAEAEVAGVADVAGVGKRRVHGAHPRHLGGVCRRPGRRWGRLRHIRSWWRGSQHLHNVLGVGVNPAAPSIQARIAIGIVHLTPPRADGGMSDHGTRVLLVGAPARTPPRAAMESTAAAVVMVVPIRMAAKVDGRYSNVSRNRL
jgi:hypothetical protein